MTFAGQWRTQQRRGTRSSRRHAANKTAVRCTCILRGGGCESETQQLGGERSREWHCLEKSWPLKPVAYKLALLPTDAGHLLMRRH